MAESPLTYSISGFNSPEKPEFNYEVKKLLGDYEQVSEMELAEDNVWEDPKGQPSFQDWESSFSMESD